MSEANETVAIVEAISVRRRAEESSRTFVNISFPTRGNEQLLATLAIQLKNPVEISFSAMQAPLFDEDDEEYEETTMTVDGQDGQKVRRPRRNGNHVQVDEPYANLGEVSEQAAKLIEDAAQTPAT